MKIKLRELKVSPKEGVHQIEIFVRNLLTNMFMESLVTMDELEELETDLINLQKAIYDYRHKIQQEEAHNE